MPLNSSIREKGETIVTSGDRLTIENAAEFSRILREAFEASNVIAIEFETDVEIDITGLQVICSACKTAAANGKKFTYNGLRPHAMAEIITNSGAERAAICKHNNNSTCIWFGGTN